MKRYSTYCSIRTCVSRSNILWNSIYSLTAIAIALVLPGCGPEQVGASKPAPNHANDHPTPLKEGDVATFLNGYGTILVTDVFDPTPNDASDPKREGSVQLIVWFNGKEAARLTQENKVTVKSPRTFMHDKQEYKVEVVATCEERPASMYKLSFLRLARSQESGINLLTANTAP